MQAGVTVGDDAITGTLHYVTGYTGFSGETELQSGNYLALHFACEAAETITVELVGGQFGPRELDVDGICIFRVTSTSQSVKVTTAAGSDSYSKTFALTGITLEV